jgi:regulator of protease activity HflC (stomatin/prohibitin superfamily)
MELKIESIVKYSVIGLFGFVVVGFGFSAIARYYDVWAQEMSGKARLAEASQSRQIQVEQAKAELDASKLRAEAIKIMGKAAKEYPEYRQQEYMAAFGEALREGKMSQIIYIPTEANIPIMEANRASNIIQKD